MAGAARAAFGPAQNLFGRDAQSGGCARAGQVLARKLFGAPNRIGVRRDARQSRGRNRGPAVSPRSDGDPHRTAAAARLCSQARAAAPRSFEPLWISGVVALKQERLADAADWLGRAHRLCPAHAGCSLRLGFTLVRLGRHAEAEEALRSAASLAPQDAETWDTLGYVLTIRGSLEESIAAHRRSVEIQPGRSLSWHNLGNALLFAGRPAEALAAQERAACADPSSASAQHGRAIALQGCYRIPEAVKAFGDALALCAGHHASRSLRLMALNYLDGIGRGEMFAEHAAFGAAVGHGEPRAFTNAPEPDRRIRVAFLSPDLRMHSVAYFLEPLLSHLDRGQFEVFLYHDHFVEDAVSARLRQNADSWRNFVGLPDGTVEAAIRADAPDLLVDLAGHTGLNRLPLFSRRLRADRLPRVPEHLRDGLLRFPACRCRHRSRRRRRTAPH